MRNNSCLLLLSVVAFFVATASFVGAVLDESQSSKSIQCGHLEVQQFYNHSKTAQLTEFPWMARIAYENDKSSEMIFACYAVLISERYLLSLAHCMRRSATSLPYAVLLGDWNIAGNENALERDCDDFGRCRTPVLMNIAEIIIHPDYGVRQRINDISLLRLSEDLQFTDHIKPICLPSREVQTKEFGSDQVTLTGWLRTKTSNRTKKLKKYVIINNIIDCRRKLPINIMAESHLCAIGCDEEEQLLSGSALMDIVVTSSGEAKYYYLIGLLAFGANMCAFPENPDVYTRVDHYLDWILRNMY